MKKGLFVLYLLVFHCFYQICTAQNIFKSQDDLRKNAEKAFAAKDYVKATPLYSQLLSTVPKDANYNYKYGVCILYTNNDKNKCLKYLQTAAKNSKTTNDVYYYLGRAYHLNQRYDEAINSFNTFKKNASTNDIQKKGVDAEIQSCNNAKNHIGGNINQVIVSKNQIPFSSFTTAYDVSAMGGKILDKPPNYKLKGDKNDNSNPIIYLNNKLKVIYFSSYGADGKNGKDIFKVTKNKKGEWTEPMNLGSPVNTASDEDYPFISQDGKTLYFSSKGHNSIGGYDVFKTIFDSVKGIWSQPVNMGTPVNSAFDDLLFVIDSLGNANFSSLRESMLGNIGFYKMIISERPIEFTNIKGSLITDKATDSKDATIFVLNYNDGSVVDVIKTDPSTGTYNLKVKPGKGYTIVVEKKGYLPHAENIYVPDQLVEHDLGQQLHLSNYDTVERLTISNYFSILEDNNDLNNAIKTEEIVSDFKHDENYKEKLKAVTISGDIVYVTPPVNDISMQAKTLTVSAFAPNKGGNNISLDTTGQLSKNNVAGGTSNVESLIKNNEIKSDNFKQENDNIITAKTTNDQLVSIAYNDAAAIQKEAKEMKKNAEIAENIGKEKDSVTVKLDNEVAFLMKKMELERNVIMKQHLKDSIQQKKEEASEKREETKVAYSLSKEYNDDGARLQKKADESYAIAKALEISADTKIGVNNQSVAKNNDNLKRNDSLNIKAATISSNDLVLKAAKNYSEQSKKKQKAADSTSMAANQLKQESVNLSKIANDTINKAIITPEPEKTRLRKKAAEMERQSAQKQIEADQALVHSNQLKDSALQEKKKGEIAKGLANDIINKKEGARTTSVANVSPSKRNENGDVKKKNESKTKSKDLTAINKSDSISDNDSLQRINTRKTKNNLVEIAILTDSKKVDTSANSVKTNKRIDNTIISAPSDILINKDVKESKDTVVAVINPIESNSNQPNASKASNSGDTVVNKTKADTLNAQAKRLNEQSQILFVKAKKTTNQKEKIKLIQQAQNLSDSSIEKQKQADVASFYVERLKKKDVLNEIVKNDSNNIAASTDTVVMKGKAIATKETAKGIKETTVTMNDNLTQKKDTRVNTTKVHSDSLRSVIPSKVKEIEVVKTSKQSNEKNLNSQQINNLKQVETFTAQAYQLDKESDSLSNQSKELYAKAKNTDDKVERRNINMQAYNFQTESANKHQQAVEKKKEANQLFPTTTTKEAAVSNPIINYEIKAQENKTIENKTILNAPSNTSAKKDSMEVIKENMEVVIIAHSPDKNIDSSLNKSNLIKPKITSENEGLNKSNPDYQKYVQLVASAKEKQKVTETEFAKAVEIENEAKEDNKQAQNKLDEANKSKKKMQKQQLTKDAKNLQGDAKIKQHDADSIYVIAKKFARQSDSQKAEAIMLRENLIIPAITDKSVVRNNESQTTNIVRTKEDISNSSSNKYVFSISNEKAATNENKTILYNEKLPDGLFFKVQIGAFKSPASPDAFKGLQPVTYEDGPNGWLRYTAGLFQTFESANLAKKEIRRIGYRDAFVVAYHNGKRISIYDAGLLVRDYTPPQQQTYQFVYIEESKVLKANSIYPEKYAPEPNDANLNAFNNAVKTSLTATIKTGIDVIAPSTTTTDQSSFNIKYLDGLFYTVQVGVYGTAIPPHILEPLKPLNTEVTPKGYYRFLSGLFNYYPPADEAKNQIARTIVPDAFVVAYYKGSRIGLLQAMELEKTVIPMKFGTANPLLTTKEAAPVKTNPLVKKDTSSIQPTKQSDIKASEETIDPSNIIFKVQLGAYREQVPFDMVDLFLKLSSKNITHTKDADGLTYYFAGTVHDYDIAVQLRKMVVAAGIKDAFVVAFYGDKKIPMDHARKLLK